MNIKNWIRVFRPPFHLALLLPFIFGAELAMWNGYTINLTVLALSTFAVFLMTSACFITNEYFDYETDIINRGYNKFSGGSRVLPDGGLERKQLRPVIWGCIFLAGLIGIVLQFYFKTGDLSLLLGSFGMFIAYAYTAKPLQLAYRGMGEISIGLCVGWLPMFSGYYLQTHEISWLPTAVSIPYFLACFILIWVNEFPDYESDKKSGKRNLIVRLGKEKAAALHNPLVVSMWLSFLPLIFIKHNLANMLIVVPVLLSALNMVAMSRGKWADGKEMEKICARMIVCTISIPVILGAIFLVDLL